MTHLNIYSAVDTRNGTICMYSGKTEQEPETRLNQRYNSHPTTPCGEWALVRTIKCPYSKSKEEEQRYINTTRQIAKDFKNSGLSFLVENIQNPARHITEINQPLYKAIKKRIYQILLNQPKSIQNAMDIAKQKLEETKREIEEAIIKKQEAEEFVSNVIATHF